MGDGAGVWDVSVQGEKMFGEGRHGEMELDITCGLNSVSASGADR